MTFKVVRTPRGFRSNVGLLLCRPRVQCLHGSTLLSSRQGSMSPGCRGQGFWECGPREEVLSGKWFSSTRQ